MASDEARAATGHLFARHLVRTIVSPLSRQGIEVVPLKGVLFGALAPEKMRSRPMADVDLLVRPEHLASAVTELVREGFQVVGRIPNAVTLRRPGDPLDVDLHGRLFGRGFSSLETEGIFQRGRPDLVLLGCPTILPSAPDTYAHLVGHFVWGRHTREDDRHVRDFAFVSTHYRLSAIACAQHLEAVGLARAARYALGEVIARSGDPFAQQVLYALPPDPVGSIVSHVARRALRRWPRNDGRGLLFAHALNSSAGRTLQSLSHHCADAVRRRLSETSNVASAGTLS